VDPNLLYYGDNLDVLRRHIKDETVDLVYLDPPFNSDVNYNVLFAEHGAKSAAQIEAFTDTWEWNTEAAAAYQEVVEQGGEVAKTMLAFRTLLGTSDMLAYLSMMAPRLMELRRVLKATGSLYLHCDPTASHYLKLLLDAVFGPEQFRNEVIWRRTGSHGKTRRWGPIHDSILYYTKTDLFTWNAPRRPYMRGHVESYFVKDEKGWRTNYYGNVLTGSGLRGGESGQPWHGFDPSAKSRHWAIPGILAEDAGEDLDGLTQHQKLDRLFELGYVTIVPGQAWPIYQHYLRPSDGQAVSDIWAFQPYTDKTVFGTDDGIDEDVRWLSPQDKERLGYPTQKPLRLLERIIQASSNPGDVVLDPFCGCGTAIDAAQDLKRRWVGIDITHLSVGLIKHRLVGRFGSEISTAYRVVGEPTTVEDAAVLAKEDAFQFQAWALGLVGARVATSDKKGGDKGVDGRLYFHDSNAGPTRQIVYSVKAGHLVPAFVRDLVGVLARENAEIGVLISFEEPSSGMRAEAASAGFYESPWGKHPRIQLRTVGELLAGNGIDYPHVTGANVTLRQARRASAGQAETMELFGQTPEAGNVHGAAAPLTEDP
jgi:DNA modification methylase